MATQADAQELAALRALSAAIGQDPHLTQAAGGNTSLKAGDTLWIKASGTWLKDALADDIMVPVAMAPLLEAVERRDPAADQPQAFAIGALNPRGLRPSIETTVHALMPQRVVLHVHCVDTISLAVQADCEVLAARRLAGIQWAYVPYRRPGLPLAQGISERLRPGIDVLILGNHGLVVAAETVTGAEALLRRVTGLLARAPRDAAAPDIAALTALAANSGYRLPVDTEAHAVAIDPDSRRMASGGSLYPDHVIFLGKGSVVAAPGEDVAAVVRRRGAQPLSILFPGLGVLMRANASAGADAMQRCLADVTARVDVTATLNYLTEAENDELVNWDAEQYRQKLNASGG
ncbi:MULTISPECIES: class II aldolase/adducin family protein [unclassified Mesorhizobium]|uniref:class II aldolase/adducin family protein n=1 Tax=unclassified Mesorhizobium TaxID=325217 RepID=UPI0011263C50|nr:MULTISPECIES: class II aldolase/adducin family protein [unclassified Mesorhizobium]TPK45823.1 class II aldolase [Mesorhizobium sp. B2-5-2]TPL16481.1 class II aldolase [Mesorhizobium sp. B2-4-9]TPL16605.1 class II aldolase [Mesorhizobium sp. B2-4-7]TPL33238.1 class II aldolase [Mesorhizobium sp. B2-4-5]TPM16712.1 class II aldolase [Mesorhizobium sp. B2-3-6]